MSVLLGLESMDWSIYFMMVTQVSVLSTLLGAMAGMSLMQYVSWQREPETWQYRVTSSDELTGHAVWQMTGAIKICLQEV